MDLQIQCPDRVEHRGQRRLQLIGKVLGYFSHPDEREGKVFVFPHLFAEVMDLYMKTHGVTEDDLRAYVRNILDRCTPGGGYALGSGNTIANYVPLKNFLIMLEEGYNYSRNPK